LAHGNTTTSQGAASLRIFPFGDTRAPVDGEHVAERRFDVDHTIDNHRSALVGAGGESALDLVEPHRAEPFQLRAIDLPEAGIVLIAEIAADLGKILIARSAALLQICGVGSVMMWPAVVVVFDLRVARKQCSRREG
jgi:hypothetical protein